MRRLLILTIFCFSLPVWASDPEVQTTKRFICPSSETTISKPHRIKFIPNFLHFKLMGKDVEKLLDVAATYNFRKSYVPQDIASSLSEGCEYQKRVVDTTKR